MLSCWAQWLTDGWAPALTNSLLANLVKEIIVLSQNYLNEMKFLLLKWQIFLYCHAKYNVEIFGKNVPVDINDCKKINYAKITSFSLVTSFHCLATYLSSSGPRSLEVCISQCKHGKHHLFYEITIIRNR